MSKELISALKNSYIIKISKKNYTTTYFRVENNKLQYNNEVISCGAWLDHPKSIVEIEEHFTNMINEGCTCEIMERNEV